ncbi:MAG: class II aldolase/adducin family protein [Desulfobacterales bacterium]|nr:MAG: class II aldolase/adducin family protein [Desulfobacterales bacterium]
MHDDDIRNQLVVYARKAYDRHLVGGTGGNFSARLNGGKMVITPSGVSLGDTSLDNLVVVDIHTGEWAPVGDFIPSKEYHFHAEILRLRPDVGAVLHVHSPYATAYAVKKLPIPMVTDAAFKQPPMPSVPFAPSGTQELKENVSRAVQENPGCKVLFMEQHGIAALGVDVVTAYNVADLTEELAWIAYLSERL